MIVVIALMVIIAGMAAFSFASLEGESPVEEPANQLARMVRQASRAAVVQGRPIVIAFDKTGFGFVNEASAGSKGRYSIPKGMKVSFQRWNGGRNWMPADELNWVFFPTGIADALRFRFDMPEGQAELAFNPLTGSITDEIYIQR
jgi:type II secretion system protein H